MQIAWSCRLCGLQLAGLAFAIPIVVSSNKHLHGTRCSYCDTNQSSNYKISSDTLSYWNECACSTYPCYSCLTIYSCSSHLHPKMSYRCHFCVYLQDAVFHNLSSFVDRNKFALDLSLNLFIVFFKCFILNKSNRICSNLYFKFIVSVYHI
jgi:hypothetical protein